MSTELTTLPDPEARALAPVAEQLGGSRRWSVELGATGAASAAVATLAFSPMLAVDPLSYAAAATLGAGLTGAALGAAMPRVLAALRHVPIVALLVGGLGIGAGWGAVTGALAGAALGATGVVMATSIQFAAVAGAVQFGWWWLPYLRRAIHGRRTWPLALTAAVIAPTLGWVGMWVSQWLFW